MEVLNPENDKNKQKLFPLLALSILVHIILFLCALDIYFSSPFENIDRNFRPELYIPPSKRVILILTDSLRFPLINNRNVPPFLKNIKNTEGCWGICQFQPFTDSRSQNKALMTGFLDYISWNGKNYNFESVLNLTQNTFYFGSLSAIKKYNYVYNTRITFFGYDKDKRYNDPNNPELIERDVFEKSREFIEKGFIPKTANQQIIVINIEGSQELSQSNPWNSKESKDILNILDGEISKLNQSVHSYFDDNETSFILTLNHANKTNKYDHNDSNGFGTRDDTGLAVIAWGSGISKQSQLININLTDVAPLISALLGIKFPSNSLGKVPMEYLNVSLPITTNILITNALQLSKLFFAIEKQLSGRTLFFYKPFQYFSSNILEKEIIAISLLMYSEKFDESAKLALGLINNIQKGIDYNNYYLYWLRCIAVVIVLVGWFFYLLTRLLEQHNAFERNISSRINQKYLNVFLLLQLILLLVYQRLGFATHYFLYVFLPMNLCLLLFCRQKYIFLMCIIAKENQIFLTLFNMLLFGCQTQMMILTFYRRCWLIPIILFNVLYIYKKTLKKTKIAHLWLILVIFICRTLYLPIQDSTFNLKVHVLSFILCMITLYFIFSLKHPLLVKNKSLSLKYLTIITISFCNKVLVHKIVTKKIFRILFIGQTISWVILGYSIIRVVSTNKSSINRLFSIVLSSISIYVLLGKGLEPIFAVIYSWYILIWIYLEIKIAFTTEIFNITSCSNQLPKAKAFFFDNVRRIFMFLSTIFLAYFGTNDISDIGCTSNWIKAFTNEDKDCVVTITFLCLKLLILFLISTTSFLVILKLSGVKITFVYITLLIISCFMNLQLFFSIQTIGSWKIISSSLGRFVASCFFPFVLLLIFPISTVLFRVTPEAVKHYLRLLRNMLLNYF